MASPILYILVALTLTSAIIAATFYLAWRFLGHEKHTLSWALAAVCATGQWLTYLAEPLFPSSGIFWLTVSAFAVGVITLGIRGHCQRTSCTVLPNKLWPITTAVYLGIIAATVIWPHVGVCDSHRTAVRNIRAGDERAHRS